MQLSLLLRLIPFEVERVICSKLNRLLGLRPSSEPFLSGDTYRSVADFVFDETRDFDPLDLSEGSVVFVSSSRLMEFANSMLPTIKTPFVLVTHQSDQNIGESHRVVADHPMVLHWFAQNCLLEHGKVTPIPIGLEDRWRHNNGAVRDFRHFTKNNRPRIPGIAFAFTLGTNMEKRIPCYKALKSSRVAYELPQLLNSSIYRQVVRKYKFIASPSGNGIDCHRTWEAIYMNCIPIVEDSYMTRFFRNEGLPLVLIDDWDEVIGWDEGHLEHLYSECKRQSSVGKSYFRYWKEKILAASKGPLSP
jgi:hypothetical protein